MSHDPCQVVPRCVLENRHTNRHTAEGALEREFEEKLVSPWASKERHADGEPVDQTHRNGQLRHACEPSRGAQGEIQVSTLEGSVGSVLESRCRTSCGREAKHNSWFEYCTESAL